MAASCDVADDAVWKHNVAECDGRFDRLIRGVNTADVVNRHDAGARNDPREADDATGRSENRLAE